MPIPYQSLGSWGERRKGERRKEKKEKEERRKEKEKRRKGKRRKKKKSVKVGSLIKAKVEETDLGVWEVIQRLLVGCVGLLQLIQHEITVTQRTPDLAVGPIQGQAPLKKLHGLRHDKQRGKSQLSLPSLSFIAYLFAVCCVVLCCVVVCCVVLCCCLFFEGKEGGKGKPWETARGCGRARRSESGPLGCMGCDAGRSHSTGSPSQDQAAFQPWTL